jgi:hypothetical protein
LPIGIASVHRLAGWSYHKRDVEASCAIRPNEASIKIGLISSRIGTTHMGGFILVNNTPLQIDGREFNQYTKSVWLKVETLFEILVY